MTEVFHWDKSNDKGLSDTISSLTKGNRKIVSVIPITYAELLSEYCVSHAIIITETN